MRITDLIGESTIDEAPLPSDWDKSVYTPQTSYKKRIEYAVARAQKMGKGSSRTAFEIEYEGRPTILKVAHNAKGMAQNEAESSILDDGYVESLGIAIPLIDYDEEHNQPVWIHLEKAQKASEKQLCGYMKCGKLSLLVDLALINAGVIRRSYNGTLETLKAQPYNYSDDDVELCEEYVSALTELATSYEVSLYDLTRPANWGMYNGKPVVIDIGFTDSVRKTYYS
jgi:hypothetical protein